MTNNEINEYLAEHLFGWVDFEYEKTRCEGCGTLRPNSVKKCCGKIINHKIELPNYIENWQQVVEKLQSIPNIKGMIYSIQEGGEIFQFAFTITTYDDMDYYENGITIGEAVCRAAVEYLKERE